VSEADLATSVPEPEDSDIELFECQRCHIEKSADNFQKNRYGMTATCLDCRRTLRETKETSFQLSTVPRKRSKGSGKQPSRRSETDLAHLLVLQNLLENIGKACIVAASSLQQLAHKEQD